METSMDYPEQYIQFIHKFNQGEYYECHDLLEEIWMEEKSNKFLQGLLQLSVGIYHFEYGNIKGARWMLNNARKYLSGYLPVTWGLDLEPMLVYIDSCLEALPDVDSIPFAEVKSVAFPYVTLELREE